VVGRGTRRGEEVGRRDQEVHARTVRSVEGILGVVEDGGEPCLD
jgi:hypothetical protein